MHCSLFRYRRLVMAVGVILGVVILVIIGTSNLITSNDSGHAPQMSIATAPRDGTTPPPLQYLRPAEFNRRLEAAAHEKDMKLDCSIDPCYTWAQPSYAFQTAVHYETNRSSFPPFHKYRCPATAHRDGDITCQPMPQGKGVVTEWYRFRDRHRISWQDAAEFDGSDGVYSDHGHPSPLGYHQGRNHELSVPSGWSSQNDTWCVPGRHGRVLIGGAIKKGYGLTNRLLSFISLAAIGMRYHRVVAVDAHKDTRIPIHKLIDLTKSLVPHHWATSFGGSSPLVLYCNYTVPIVMPKRMAPLSRQVMDRKQVALRPHKVLALMDRHFVAIKAHPLVYMHEMFLRYPFEQDGDLSHSPANLLCGMVYHHSLLEVGRAAVRRIRQQRASSGRPMTWWNQEAPTTVDERRFVAWHLRMEVSDSIAIRKHRKASTAHDVTRFFDLQLLPLLEKQRIIKVVLCAGKLPSGVLSSLRLHMMSKGVTLLEKHDVVGEEMMSWNDFGTAGQVREREGLNAWISPTPTDAAVVDAVILELADVAIMTTTSSFTALVYARRCGGSFRDAWSVPGSASHDSPLESILRGRGMGCTAIGLLYVYDVYLDGAFTSIRHVPCGYQVGPYLAAPPAHVLRPPPELDVFAVRYHGDSPLYRDEPHRNAMPAGMTPIPRESP